MIQKCDFFLGDTQIHIILQDGFSNQSSVSNVPSHCHPNFELHYIESGSFRLTCQNKIINTPEYTLILIPPKIYHSFELIDGTPRRLSFEFRITKARSGSPLYEKYKALFDSLSTPFINRGFLSETLNVGKRMGVLQSEEEICKLRAELTLVFLKLCELLRGEASATPATAELDPSDEDITVIKLLQYINNNYQCKIKLSNISKEIGLSERQIQRILKSRMDKTFSGLLSEKRIAKARELIIQSPESSLEDIAHLCGFQSYVSFWGQFKRNTGITPEEYKKQGIR